MAIRGVIDQGTVYLCVKICFMIPTDELISFGFEALEVNANFRRSAVTGAYRVSHDQESDSRPVLDALENSVVNVLGSYYTRYSQILAVDTPPAACKIRAISQRLAYLAASSALPCRPPCAFTPAFLPNKSLITASCFRTFICRASSVSDKMLYYFSVVFFEFLQSALTKRVDRSVTNRSHSIQGSSVWPVDIKLLPFTP
jgi:hypothetical protein